MQNAEHNTSHEEGDEDDAEIREENRILQSLLRRHQWAEDLSRNAAMIRFSRMTIVCRQPATTIRQAQSSTVKLPKRTAPPFHQRQASVSHAPRWSITIRHGFDITPLNSRCTPTACPNIPM